MTSLVAQWIPQPAGQPLIEWLCGDCGDFRLFEVNNVDTRSSELGVRLMTCTHCGAPDMLSMVGLAGPPPGYALYRVEWRTARYRPPASPAEPAFLRGTDADLPPRAVHVVAASRSQAHRQATARRVDDLSGLECLIDGEPYLPED
jgi:hypothetical protein